MKKLVLTTASACIKYAGQVFFLLTVVFISSCQGQDKQHVSDGTSNEMEVIPVKQTATMNTCFNPPFVPGFCNSSKPKYDPYADIIRSGYAGKSGNLWFGTLGRGVFRYDGSSFINFTERDGLSHNHVYAIYEDKDGYVWFGNKYGVTRYDGKDLSNFPLPEPVKSNGNEQKVVRPAGYISPSKTILSIFQDKKGRVWFGSLGGDIYSYDVKSGNIVWADLPEGDILRGPVQRIYEDTKGHIWFGSVRYDGISFTSFATKEGFSGNSVYSILEDKKGHLWFGTMDSGLFRYDGKTFTRFTEKDGLCSNNIISILEDGKGNLWFGSDIKDGTKPGGVCFYNGTSFTRVVTKEGLMFTGVWTILEDKKGHIWFGSRGGGLLRYDGKNFTEFSDKVSNSGC